VIGLSHIILGKNITTLREGEKGRSSAVWAKNSVNKAATWCNISVYRF
jgi:hypothetical protein